MPDALDSLARVMPEATIDGSADRKAWAVGGTVPEAVARPTSVEHMSSVLDEVSALELAVVPLGSRHDVGCEAPSAPFVALSTEGLDGIVAYEPGDLTITTGAGTTLGEVGRVLREHRQWIPVQPPFAPLRTVGGVMATGASGAMSTTFGATRDQVLGATVVTGDGRVLRLGGRVMKNVAGFDLTRLMVGSRGTLGVIVEATLRVFPLPEEDRALVAEAPSVEDLLPLARRVAAAPVLPASAVIAERGPGGSDGCVLLVRVQGASASVEADSRALFGDALDSVDVMPWDRIESSGLAAHARDASALGSTVARLGGAPTAVPQTIAACRAHLPSPSLWLDALSGSMRVSVAEHVTADILLALRSDLASRGGTLLLERASADVAAAVGALSTPETLRRINRGLRSSFDPAGVLSPGRFMT